MVQDVDWEQQVVIVHLTLVLPGYYDWPLLLGLLRDHKISEMQSLLYTFRLFVNS